MVTYSLVLLEKIPLTHDVFELVFARPSDPAIPDARPGQFNMFILPSGLRRSYSIAWQTPEKLHYIIKRLEGGPGSTEICGLPIGSTVAVMPPLGHFTLRDGDVARCHIGTGTGFAPLWFQLGAAIERGGSAPLRLVFGVREDRDRLYGPQLAALVGTTGGRLDVREYLSREDAPGTTRGYVTDAIDESLIAEFREFYLCGSPAMVKDARAKLESLGVEKERVFFEQY